MEYEKTLLSHKLCALRCLISRPQLWSRNNSSYFILVRNYFSLKNYVTSEGAISHNVLYYQQLSIALYQVKFFMITIIFSNYQQCPMPLNSLKLHFVVNYAYDNASQRYSVLGETNSIVSFLNWLLGIRSMQKLH